MRKAILTLTITLAGALTAPLATQASPKDDGLSLTLGTPVNFAPTADCPTGAALYGLALHGERGSGENCIGDEIPADCPPGVTAQFCQNVPVRMTFSFAGGRIEADGAIFEAWNCDASCAVDQRWSGTVTTGTRRFHALAGATVSGGGLFAFDQATFALVAFDETLVVG